MNRLAVFGAGAALLLAAAPASAVTTFANFSPASNGFNIHYAGAMDGSGTITSVDQLVHFTFLNTDGTPGGTTFDAMMNLTATTGAGTVVGGLAILPVLTGTVTFTALSPVNWGGSSGTNLLSVSFAGGALTALWGGSTANYGVSTPPATVNFTSDFLDFSDSTQRDLAFAIDSVSPAVGFAFGGQRLHDGTATGNFGADVFTGTPQGVPEPGSWVLMLAGFGLAGVVLRTQRRRTEVSFG